MRSLPILAVFAFLPVFWLPPTGASAASVCDAPFTGCLAKCGNKVTTMPQDNDEQRGCFYGLPPCSLELREAATRLWAWARASSSLTLNGARVAIAGQVW